MSSGASGGRSTAVDLPGRRRVLALLSVVAVIAVVAAVLLTRGDPPPAGVSAAPSSRPSTEPSRPPVTGAAMAVDGLPDLRLGQEVRQDAPRWSDSTAGDGSSACRLGAPETAVGEAGLSVVAGAVAGRVVSVVVVQPGPEPVSSLALPHGLTMGDDLRAAAALPGAELAVEELPEAVIVDPESGAVVTGLQVVTVDEAGTQTRYAGLGRDRGIEYVEVRTPEAAACSPATGLFFWPPVPEAEGLPELTAEGRGDITLGRPVAELVDSGVLAPEVQYVPGSCPRYSPPAGSRPGLAYVEATGDGRVAGVAVNAGGTSDGLQVGDRFSEVLAMYPQASVPAETDPYRPTEPLPVHTVDGVQLAVVPGTRPVYPPTLLWGFMAAEPSVALVVARSEACWD